MRILEQITSSEDVKKLNNSEVQQLCGEIRSRLLQVVSKNGGHLASNLGTVELSVALHRVYDSKTDRILFDVGHQCYTHKMLSGRLDAMDQIRQYGGISGFPKPNEAIDDAFTAGHSSESVSLAIGMARARTLLQENYDVVAVIGDGALTGGLAMEGLADAASSGEPVVIVLNDNNMSIGNNVGGLSRALQSLRYRSGYIRFKKLYRASIGKLPSVYQAIHKLKEKVKANLLPTDMFTDLGFYYLGPVDGHDVKTLETVIRWARDQRVPTVIHVLTKKGKGYAFAEADPETYHGVGPFDLKTGVQKSTKPDFSAQFGNALCALAAEDKRVSAITAAMASGTGLSTFAETYPERFFDVGIAEGHAVTMGAAMAKQGLVPVFAVYSSFLQRGYDMLIQDAALQHLHLILAVDRAGLVGNDGVTHHGLYDVAYLSSVPGMTILCPASFAEVEEALRYAVREVNGPVAIRYPRGGEGKYNGCHAIGEQVLREGADITLVTYGTIVNEVLSAADLLKEKGISAEVVKLGQILPCDFTAVRESIQKTKNCIVIEEVIRNGCLGNTLAAVLAEKAVPFHACKLINLGDGLIGQGTVQQLYQDCGLDASSICTAVQEVLKHE